MVEIKHGQVAAALDLHDTPAQGISCSRTNTLLLNPILTITEEWCHLWRLLLVCPTSGIHWYSSIMAVANMWLLGFKDYSPPWGGTAPVALMWRSPVGAVACNDLTRARRRWWCHLMHDWITLYTRVILHFYFQIHFILITYILYSSSQTQIMQRCRP